MPEKKLRSETDEFGFPFEALLEEPEPPKDSTPAEARQGRLSETLSGTFEERLKILKEAIEEIDTEIDVRKDLHRGFEEGLEKSRHWLAVCLRKFEDWQFGHKPSVDFRRTSLERELLGTYKESRSERQRAFSDIVSLKKERRGLVMEYKSLKATGKMVSPETGG